MRSTDAPSEELPEGVAGHLWTGEGQSPIVLLAGQVLFFNHGAAPTPSAAIIQLQQPCCWRGPSKELLNMQHSSERLAGKSGLFQNSTSV